MWPVSAETEGNGEAFLYRGHSYLQMMDEEEEEWLRWVGLGDDRRSREHESRKLWLDLDTQMSIKVESTQTPWQA